MRGLSLVAASGGHSSSWCAGLSLSRPLLLQSTGSRCAGSVIVAHGPSCSTACGIFPDQGSNPRPLHWQADSQPLCHQGSPSMLFLLSLSVTIFILSFSFSSFLFCSVSTTLLHFPCPHLQQTPTCLMLFLKDSGASRIQEYCFKSSANTAFLLLRDCGPRP